MFKVCTKCKESKPATVEYFQYSSDTKDGLTCACKQCRNAASRESYQRNKEKILKRTIEYQKNHPLVREKARAKWKAVHREEYLEQTKARSRRWRETNRDKDREASREWRLNNPDAYRIIQNRAKARRVGSVGEFTETQWQQLKDAFGYRCPRCGRSEPDITLSIDHIIPLARGGCNDISNIQPLCRACNAAKGARVIIDYRYVIASVVSQLSE